MRSVWRAPSIPLRVVAGRRRVPPPARPLRTYPPFTLIPSAPRSPTSCMQLFDFLKPKTKAKVVKRETITVTPSFNIPAVLLGERRRGPPMCSC